MAWVKDGPSVNKVEETQAGRNAEGKKPNSSRSEGQSLMELSGYNPKRQEFDPEYDNDYERLVAEMEFKDTDTEEERELKLRVLHIHSKRLDERKRRIDFMLERNLLYPSPFERDLTPEERALCRPFDPFMRFHSKEEHGTLKRIEELQEAEAVGCRTAAEVDRYLEQKRRKEAEENSRRPKHKAQMNSQQIGPGNQGNPNPFIPSESVEKDSSASPAGQGSSTCANDLDITDFNETQLLSDTEKRLCREIHLPPPDYLKMQEVMTKEIFSGNISKKSDAHPLFNLEASKVDRVYDMLVKKGFFSGQGSSDGKRAFYHCNYCHKDITGKIRIKCAVCLDFELCVECFSVGAEVTSHKSNHAYRVMEDPSLSPFSPDWNADEEMLLLEGQDQNFENHDSDPANIGGSAADNRADVE